LDWEETDESIPVKCEDLNPWSRRGSNEIKSTSTEKCEETSESSSDEEEHPRIPLECQEQIFYLSTQIMKLKITSTDSDEQIEHEPKYSTPQERPRCSSSRHSHNDISSSRVQSSETEGSQRVNPGYPILRSRGTRGDIKRARDIWWNLDGEYESRSTLNGNSSDRTFRSDTRQPCSRKSQTSSQESEDRDRSSRSRERNSTH
jgi:hypothetical protein